MGRAKVSYDIPSQADTEKPTRLQSEEPRNTSRCKSMTVEYFLWPDSTQDLDKDNLGNFRSIKCVNYMEHPQVLYPVKETLKMYHFLSTFLI